MPCSISAGLQMKIVAEDKVTRSKIEAAVGDWDREKPIQGSLSADVAMNSINVFEGRIGRLKDEYDRLCHAKEALNLEHVRDDRLDPVIEEIRDLKSVWTALSGIWAQIAELRESPWSSITPRKLRQSLEGLLGNTREIPSRMRQYAAFEYVQDVIRQYQRSVSLVAELKSDALRERHWRQLYKSLRLAGHYSPSQMTLGTVWDMDLKKNEAPIREVLMQASGEVALEEYLKQVRSTVPACTVASHVWMFACRRSRRLGPATRSISSTTSTRRDSSAVGTISSASAESTRTPCRR